MLPVQNRGPQTQEASPSPFSDSAYQSSRPEGVRLRTPFVFWNALGCVFPLCFRAGVPHLAEGGVTSHRHRVKPFHFLVMRNDLPGCANAPVPDSTSPPLPDSVWPHQWRFQCGATRAWTRGTPARSCPRSGNSAAHPPGAQRTVCPRLSPRL